LGFVIPVGIWLITGCKAVKIKGRRATLSEGRKFRPGDDSQPVLRHQTENPADAGFSAG